MAYKILTEQEVYAIGGKESATNNLLCTYARAQALGCVAKSGYSFASNQLVYEGSLQKNVWVSSISFTVSNASCSNMYEGWATTTTLTFNVTSVANYSDGHKVTIESNAAKSVSVNVGTCTSQSDRTLYPSYTYSVTYDGYTGYTTVTATCSSYCGCNYCTESIDTGNPRTWRVRNNCSYAIRLRNGSVTYTVGPHETLNGGWGYWECP